MATTVAQPAIQAATPGDPATTSTAGFLAALRAAPDRPLVFELDGRTLVQPGYHVTEVKAVSVEAMDCGGQAAAWRETLVQLWNPGSEADRGHMSTGKFLAIYERVAASVPVRAASEIRFEYGDRTRPAVHYHVTAVRPDADAVRVELREPAVTCKARDRQAQAQGASCCGPAAAGSGSGASACCG